MSWKLFAFLAQKKQKMLTYCNFLKVITNLTDLYFRWKTHEVKPNYRACPMKVRYQLLAHIFSKAVCQSQDHMMLGAGKDLWSPLVQLPYHSVLPQRHVLLWLLRAESKLSLTACFHPGQACSLPALILHPAVFYVWQYYVTFFITVSLRSALHWQLPEAK